MLPSETSYAKLRAHTTGYILRAGSCARYLQQTTLSSSWPLRCPLQRGSPHTGGLLDFQGSYAASLKDFRCPPSPQTRYPPRRHRPQSGAQSTPVAWCFKLSPCRNSTAPDTRNLQRLRGRAQVITVDMTIPITISTLRAKTGRGV